ncbi:hypothetical protein Lal_00042579 [Lupinus albus]|nr:hypothetical protein Lal_00042579 [Lupinus albus]
MRKDPKVGGGIEGTCQVTKNPNQHSPRLTLRGIESPLWCRLSLCGIGSPLWCRLALGGIGSLLWCRLALCDLPYVVLDCLCGVDLPYVVLDHLCDVDLPNVSVRETNSPLPYAIIISNILEHFGASTAGESKIALNVRDSKIHVDAIHKMSFFRDFTDRTYKHRSDIPTAPVDPTTNVFVNQPAQQPSDFHTESS